jgi:hypothetical protein
MLKFIPGRKNELGGRYFLGRFWLADILCWSRLTFLSVMYKKKPGNESKEKTTKSSTGSFSKCFFVHWY